MQPRGGLCTLQRHVRNCAVVLLSFRMHNLDRFKQHGMTVYCLHCYRLENVATRPVSGFHLGDTCIRCGVIEHHNRDLNAAVTDAILCRIGCRTESLAPVDHAPYYCTDRPTERTCKLMH